MKEENKLDKFFREKMQDNHPEFDPKFWEQAERMLDAGPEPARKRKRIAWWWLLPLLLISGCGAWFLGLFSETNANRWSADNIKEPQEQRITEGNDKEKISTQLQDSTEGKYVETKEEVKIEENIKSENLKSAKTKEIKTEKGSSSNPSGSSPVPGTLKPGGDSKLILPGEEVKNEAQEPLAQDKNAVDPQNSLKTPTLETPTPKAPIKLSQVSPVGTLTFSPESEEQREAFDFEIKTAPKLLPQKSKPFTFGLSAEVESWIYYGTDSLKVNALAVGGTFDYRLNDKSELHFDLLVRRENERYRIGIEESSEAQKDFGFGAEQIQRYFDLKAQYHIEATLLYRRALNEKHHIGLGLGATYLTGIRAALTESRNAPVFNFELYEVGFTDTESEIEEGWWDFEDTRKLMPYGQLRYDYRASQKASVFLKVNAQYNEGLLRGFEDRPFLQIGTAVGFNYRF